MKGNALLEKFMHFELAPKDPYKDREVIHIPVKQLGIPSVVVVRTTKEKKLRKDRYGHYRMLTAVRRRKSKSTPRKQGKNTVVHLAANKVRRSGRKIAAPRIKSRAHKAAGMGSGLGR